MKLLLDTHVVLWCVADPGALSPQSRELLENGGHELFCSVASLWEIGVKAALGKLRMQEDLLEALRQASIGLLSILPEHALEVAKLPHNHGDPFDRMLVVQAQKEGLTLVTRDLRLKHYFVPILEA